MRGEDSSNVAVTIIPTQNRVTLQILDMCPTFNVLKETFVVSRRAEQSGFASVRIALSLLLRNRYSGRKWRTLSHRKRMSLNGSFGIHLTELPLSVCGYKKFQLDPFGDHLCTNGALDDLLL